MLIHQETALVNGVVTELLASTITAHSVYVYRTAKIMPRVGNLEIIKKILISLLEVRTASRFVCRRIKGTISVEYMVFIVAFECSPKVAGHA
jgi:ribosomal protein S28E/S33